MHGVGVEALVPTAVPGSATAVIIAFLVALAVVLGYYFTHRE
jgi:hypothetical protein